ncbi:MAG: hypothetical protein JXQ93_05910 [Flavobacteriaceae bacterium]
MKSFKIIAVVLIIFTTHNTQFLFLYYQSYIFEIMDTLLLELKLKRLKISFKKEGGELIIGKAKTDITILFFLILLPFSISLFIIFYSLASGVIIGKLYIAAVVLFIFSTFNFRRIRIKKEANNSTKTLTNSTLKITIEKVTKTFDFNNILKFSFTIKEINKDIFEGKLFLKDNDNNSYEILGFDDDNERLVQNDLIWFIEFFKEYLQIK